MRRRVAALVILLLVVALLVWALTAAARGGRGDEGSSETETAESTPTTTLVTEPTVTVPGESESATAPSTAPSTAPTTATATTQVTAGATAPATSAVAAPARTGACELKDLVITAITAQPSYAAGVQPVFQMEVDNPTDTECVIDLNKNLLRFEVYDMGTNERIWSDTDCYEPVATGIQTFPPGAKQRWEARWSVTASQPGQCSNRPAVKPGAYFLHAVIGDNASEATPFNIT